MMYEGNEEKQIKINRKRGICLVRLVSIILNLNGSKLYYYFILIVVYLLYV